MPEQIQPAKDYFPSGSPAPVLSEPSASPAPIPTPVENKTASLKKNKPPVLRFLFITLAVILLAGTAFALTRLFKGKNLTNNKIEIVYWGLFEPPSVMQQVISDYEKDHPNVKIVYSQQNLTQYRERLSERLTSADQEKTKNKNDLIPEIPDIFRIHQSWTPMFSGLLSEVPSGTYSNADYEKTFYPSAGTSLELQGKYVGIPLMADGLALYCNQDLFKAKGIDLPQNWEEVKLAARQLATRDSEGKLSTAGVALGATSNVDHWSDILGLMLMQAGVDLSNPSACSKSSDGEDVCPGADALRFFTNFVSVDRVWSAAMPSSTYAFAKGDLAMYFGPSWRVFDIENTKSRLQNNFQYKIIPVPQLQTDQSPKIGWSSYWVEVVSKKSNYQTEAWEFLKYLSSKEVMQKLFQAQSATRLFGEPFSRVDMADLLVKDHPYANAFISQAPYSKNWYLSSFTSDNGINDKIIDYYKNAVNAVNQGNDPVSSLQTAGKGAVQILGQYGVTK